MPDSVSETREVMRDLEQALADRHGGWLLFDAMSSAHKACEADEVERLFPPSIMKRMVAVVSTMSGRCGACSGRGSDDCSRLDCMVCSGSGHVRLQGA